MIILGRNICIRTEGENITLDSIVIKRIREKYHKQHYAQKLTNEIDKFPYKVSKLMQEEIDNLDRPIVTKETEFIV